MATKRKITRTEQPAVPTPVEDLTGQTVGDNFRLVRIIGTGGNAAVFEGRRLKPGLKVAVKVLAPGGTDVSIEERFRQEARIARTLKGVNQVAFLDEGEVAPGQPFWVMEFLEGEDLASRLERLGHLEISAAIQLGEGIGAALSEAHDQGIVHRDIKPANVFLARGPGGSEAVKVLDFGAAHVQRSDAQLTQTGKVVGTPWYMSPEQARGQPLDPRSDQFSLAILMFQILTGQVPFNAEQPTDVLFKITGDPHPSLASIEPSLPEEIDPVFDRALAKRADDRFPTVSQFIDALRLALGSKPRRPQTVVVKRKDLEAARKVESPPVELERALLNLALLEAEPITRAKQLAVEKHIELADAVLQLGLLEEEPLLNAATGPGRRFHLQARVGAAAPAVEAVRKLSVEAARRLRVVPLGWSDILSEIRVYSAAPALPDLEEQLKAAAGAQSVSILLALPSAVRALADKIYGSPDLGAPPAAGGTPVEVAPPASTEAAAGPRSLKPETVSPAPDPLPAIEPARPPVATSPPSEYVPLIGANPALTRLTQERAHRAARRAAQALGARYVALTLEEGIRVSSTLGEPLPATVDEAALAWVAGTPWPVGGWSARSTPVSARGRVLGNLLVLFEDAHSEPLGLDTLPTLQGVAGQLALALDPSQLLARASHDLEAWLDGDRGPGVSSISGTLVSGCIALQVPVVAIDLRHVVDDPGEPQERLGRLRLAMQRAEATIFAFGGGSLSGSDTVIALWGSREAGPTDVWRAAACARALGSTLPRPSLARIGLAFGEVLLGCDPSRRDGPSVVTGPAVISARALGELSPGRVVTQSEVLQRLGGQLGAAVEPVPGHPGALSVVP